MSSQQRMWQGFDPEFDDTELTYSWLHVPIAQVPPGLHKSGFRVERRMVQEVNVFGQPMRVAAPLECRLLFDPEGRLWMSDTPQERIMMCNNGRHSQGNVLVGGLGLGLFLQYAVFGAVGQATSFTVIERSPVVRDIVEPTLSMSLDVPFEVRTGDVAAYMSRPVTIRYDTIFLDTWDTLDAAHLPSVNYLRDLALRHLATEGRLLLWGYRWMVRLFEEACRQLLIVAPGKRRAKLLAQLESSPQALALLKPVVDYFGERVVGDMEDALAWCRHYIVQRVASV